MMFCHDDGRFNSCMPDEIDCIIRAPSMAP